MQEKNQSRRVLIIGGGASGLMAAITAARRGARVTVLERQPQVGRKLLSTGNGRCNLSNEQQDLSCYRCDTPDFPAQALSLFGLPKTLEFFRELGIYVKSRKGYLYPCSDQAASVAEALRMEAEHLGVRLSCNAKILELGKAEGIFFAKTPGWTYEAESLILACGSQAAEGGSFDGYQYARQFGHGIRRPLPALVPLKAGRDWPGQLAGIRVEASVSLYGGRKLLAENTGEVQLTSYGISGIPVFQVSRYAARALERREAVRAELRFLPSFSKRQLGELLRELKSRNSYKRAEVFIAGLLPGKLIPVLLRRAGIQKGCPAGDITEEQVENLIRELCTFQIPITDTRDFSQAQICTGGVDVREVAPETMESRLLPGLYFAGELLDVDGACGGYNLQWAWTSGYLAGCAASASAGSAASVSAGCSAASAVCAASVSAAAIIKGKEKIPVPAGIKQR